MDDSVKRTTEARTGSLHFAIMCNGYHFKRWQADCLYQLFTLPQVKPVLLIVDGNSRSHKRKWSHALYHLFCRLFFTTSSTALCNLEKELSHLPAISCLTERNGAYSEYFSSADLATIRSYQPDVILRFGFNIIRGDILELPVYGVWSYHHGDEKKYRGGPPGFWEIAKRDRITGVILQRLTNELDKGVVLKKGYFATVGHSYREQVDKIFDGASVFVKQASLDILNGVFEPHQSGPSASTAPVFKLPGHVEMIRFIYRLVVNRIALHVNELFLCEQWNIGVVKQSHGALLTADLQPVCWMPDPKKGRFVADPFAMELEEGIQIVFEDYDYKTRKATISSVVFDPDTRQFSSARPFLSSTGHLAYPFLIAHEGQVFCVPESADLGRVQLHKWHPTTKTVSPDNTLLSDSDCVDSTLVFHDQKWWLFATRKQAGTNEALFVYFADRMEGPYSAHLCNPVKIDVRSARPAGSLFTLDGRLYRPAQNCERTYGGSIQIFEIVRLTESEFEERLVKEVLPVAGSYTKGLHTLNSAGDWLVVDGKRMVFSVHSFFYQLKRKLLNRV